MTSHAKCMLINDLSRFPLGLKLRLLFVSNYSIVLRDWRDRGIRDSVGWRG